MPIRPELIDELLQECSHPQELFQEGGLFKQLTKALIERCLQTELEVHLQDPAYEREGKARGNRRNGYSRKTVKGEVGERVIEVPRDRNGEFEPQLIRKGQTRLAGLDEKILGLYARGLTVRDIQDQLQELYGVEVSAGLISQVTDGVLDDVKAWQTRPLEAIYPIVWMDALVLKVREEGRVINKALHLVLGVNLDGEKDLLGMWLTPTEGAKFWLSVLTDLQNRGVQDIFIACVDGLSGFPEAIAATYPQAYVQLCLVHLVRSSLKYVTAKDRQAVATDLKAIYSAVNETEAHRQWERFAQQWDSRYPTISKLWRERWSHVIPMFSFPPEIRRVIYTTNSIESLNMTVRKVTRNRRIFPSDTAALKAVYLALQNLATRWTRPIANWKLALSRFAIEFEGRMPPLPL